LPTPVVPDPVPSCPTITRDVFTGNVFVSVILKLRVPVGTVINGGCQVVPPSVWAEPFSAVQVAVLPATGAPHVQPHIGTVWPSGRVVVCLFAVRVTDDWAEAMPTDKSRIVTASTAVFIVALR